MTRRLVEERSAAALACRMRPSPPDRQDRQRQRVHDEVARRRIRPPSARGGRRAAQDRDRDRGVSVVTSAATLRPSRNPAGGRVGIGGQMLAGVTDPDLAAEEPEQSFVMLDRRGRLSGEGSASTAGEGGPIWPTSQAGRRRAADHHGAAPDAEARAASERSTSPLATTGIATARRPPRWRPSRRALVELLARAAVHRHCGDAERAGATGEFGRVERSGRPSRAASSRSPAPCTPRRSLDDAAGVIEIAHQRRAGIAAGDALGRAAHVDVDDVGAGASASRGLAHPARVAAGELDDVRGDPPLGPQARLGRPEHELVRRDHLGDDEPAPKRLAIRRKPRR